MSSFHPESNPLMEKWENGFPPFARIQACHYKPAIEYGFKRNLAAIENIVASKEEASFENTVVEFDRCAEPLTQTLKVFFNLCSSHCPPELQAVEREMAAPIAGHRR